MSQLGGDPIRTLRQIKKLGPLPFFLLFNEIGNISREFRSFFNKLSLALAIEAQQISNTSRRISLKVHHLKSNLT